ncbi:MAG: lysylphosphatidylglycerol synthase transmembrane domain-containing protein [Candidatus Electryoneaceae bacterium]|nr:lysylphosphatidylglycerol synthase transmembrane domain-containing protein [Candidatus Electryoneaceae bacterium]
MNNRRIILGIVFSGFLIYMILWKPQITAFIHGDQGLYHAFFGSLRIDFAHLWNTLKGIKFLPLTVGILVTPVHLLVRAHRWSVMVEPIGRLRVFDSYSLQMVGYFANAVLPLRMGELIRGILLGRRIGVSKSSALATVVVERVIDVLSMLLVTAAVGFIYPFPDFVREGVIVLGIGSVAVMIVIVYLAFMKDPLDGFIGRILNLFPQKIAEKLLEIVEQFINGFGLLKAGRRYGVVTVESLGLWVLYALQVYFILVAFDFPRDYNLIADSPYLACFVILVLSAIALSLPSAPGGVGTFHMANIFSLSLFGVPGSPAAGFALVIHAVTVLFFLVVGIPFMLREGIGWKDLRRLEQNSQ